MEKHNCFISFKKEDIYYKDEILKLLKEEQIKGKALDKTIESDDIDYVMQVIRSEYMSNTSVTLFLIGEHSSENEGLDNEGYNKQSFIIRELQATLYDGKGNNRSGLLGIVLPKMYGVIYQGERYCSICQGNHNIVEINDNTVIREFSQNYYLHSTNKCKSYSEEDRFCVLVKYDDFIKKPNEYINAAFRKTQDNISNYVHWRDIEHLGKLR